MKWNSLHIENMWIQQLCDHKVQDFAIAFWAQKVSWDFKKWVPGLIYILCPLFTVLQSLYGSQVVHQAKAYPRICSRKRVSLNRMLIFRRITPRITARIAPSNEFSSTFSSTHYYTYSKRGTVRVNCLAQEHNTMSLVAQSGDKGVNHACTNVL